MLEFERGTFGSWAQKHWEGINFQVPMYVENSMLEMKGQVSFDVISFLCAQHSELPNKDILTLTFTQFIPSQPSL